MKKIISSVLVLFVILGMALLPVQAATNGSCGSGVRWSFNNGTLTISGTGSMSNYMSFSSTPWCDFRLQINTLIIENGVSNIGTSTFSNCTELTSVTIPSSVSYIGKYAFTGCWPTDVYYRGTPSKLDKIISTNLGNSSLASARMHYIFTITHKAKEDDAVSISSIDVYYDNTSIDYNFFVESDKPIYSIFILAVYDSDGKLTTIFEADTLSGETEKLISGTLPVTEKDYAFCKAMIWNSYSEMKPLTNAILIEK
ncbi:MAG: leucine-rich repeat protein [Clostridia bacterium]|nr:leucine-rich repeat protein [Clostridia bacterium]